MLAEWVNPAGSAELEASAALEVQAIDGSTTRRIEAVHPTATGKPRTNSAARPAVILSQNGKEPLSGMSVTAVEAVTSAAIAVM